MNTALGRHAVRMTANDAARLGVDRPLRVALVTPEYVTEASFDGGLSNYTHRVALALAGLGHTPVVFVSSDRDEVIEHRGIQVQRVNIYPSWLRLLNRYTLHRLEMTLVLLAQSGHLNRALRRSHRARPFDIAQYSHLGASSLLRPSGLPAVVRLSSYTPWFNRWSGDAPPRFGRQQNYWEMLALRRAVSSPSRLNADARRTRHGQPRMNCLLVPPHAAVVQRDSRVG